jgi:hypothetical protein
MRKALADHKNRSNTVEGGVLPMKQLAKKLKDSGIGISEISLEQATDFYEASKTLEWTRLFAIQT